MTSHTDRPQLVRIEHERCQEYAARTFVWAPADWTAEQIDQAVSNAQDAYLNALNIAVDKKDPPNDFKPYGPPPYEKYPDLTVAQIKEQWQAKKAVWEAWNAEQRQTTKSFSAFLAEQGLTHIDDHQDAEVIVNWGHRHGTPIQYDETSADTLPTPAKLAGTDTYDADDFS